MSDTPPPRRRVPIRWITLAELLAIAAVAISALTLWNSYRERSATETEHAVESAKASRTASILILHATADKEGKLLTLAPRLDAQVVQGQTISFPKALDLSPVETTGNARIERNWLENALVRARRAAEAPDKTVGDARLPLFIVTRYLVDGDAHVDRAIYELGYATDHSFIGGTSVRLRGLSRAGSAADDGAGAKRIDSLWASRNKTPAKS